MHNDSIPPRLPEVFGVHAAMLRDIDLLKRESPIQQNCEDVYSGMAQRQMLVVENVTETDLQFQGQPQRFHGNYTGRFCPMRSYPSYAETDIGGNRYVIVKDNFGVWMGFLTKL